jgi:murein hydrolase activator
LASSVVASVELHVRYASGLTALLLLTAIGHAEPGRSTTRDPRAVLADQLAAELQTLTTTVTTVDEKVAAAEDVRQRRVRAAYRILRAPLAAGDDASSADRMSAARRRAAARLLLQRDRAERELLADEAAQLRSAEITLRAATAVTATIALPESLAVPAKGTIARRFGTIIHDRSKATLARRGIDFDVQTLAQAVAPADGVVRYAGPMRGLDHGVILDHGDYVTVVAKLAEVAIPAGTKVARGDRLGRAARQRVYFEVRAKVGPGGLPIDPEPLLARAP